MKSFSSALTRTKYSATVPSSAGFSLSKTTSASHVSASNFKESADALRSSALRPLAVPSTCILDIEEIIRRYKTFVMFNLRSGCFSNNKRTGEKNIIRQNMNISKRGQRETCKKIWTSSGCKTYILFMAGLIYTISLIIAKKIPTTNKKKTCSVYI